MLISSIVSVLLLVSAYLLGSLPTGYLAGRYLQGIDIREYGSGSTGATNVLRTLGKSIAIAVLIIDALKGALALGLVHLTYQLLAPEIMPLTIKPWLIFAAAFAAIFGHSKSIWINFTGGKSVATGLGVLLIMNPLIGLSALGVFALVLAISRIVSLGSVCAAIAVNILMIIWGQPLAYIIFAQVAGLYVIWRHQANLQRILAGSEPKIGQKLSQE